MVLSKAIVFNLHQWMKRWGTSDCINAWL